MLIETACSARQTKLAGEPAWLAPLLGSLPVRLVTPGQDLHPINGPLIFVARGDFWILDRSDELRWYSGPLARPNHALGQKELGEFSRAIRSLLGERDGEPTETRPRRVFLTVPDQKDIGRYRVMETIIRDNGFEPVPTLRDRFGSLWGVPAFNDSGEEVWSERGGGVGLAGAAASGLLQKDDIRSVMKSNTANFTRCVDETPDTIGIEGRLTVHFVIEADGHVSTVRVVDDTVGHAAIVACMATAIRGVRFPAPKGNGQVFVTYPFLFK